MLPTVLAFLLAGGPAPSKPPRMESFEDCDGLRRAQPDARLPYVCYYRHGRLGNRLEEARDRLEVIVEAEPQRGWARIVLGNILVDLGDRKRATELTRDALPMILERDDVNLGEKATVVLDFATTLRDRGLLEEALEQFRRAEKIAAEAKMPDLHAMTRLEQADMHRRLGTEWAKMRELLDEALPVVLGTDVYILKLKALVIAANVAKDSGDQAKSIAYRRQMIELSRAEGDGYTAANAEAIVALLRSHAYDPRIPTSDPAPYAALAAAALETAEASDNHHAAAIARCTLGHLERDHAAAVALLRKCLAGEKKVEFVQGMRDAKDFLAHRLPMLGPEYFDEALALAAELREDGERSGELETRFRTTVQYASVSWAVRQHEPAVEASLRALDRLELLRDLQVDEVDRARALSRFASPYYLLSGKLLARPDRTDDELELAFATMERLRARSLLERLVAAKSSPYADDDAVATERQSVLREIAGVQRRLLASSTSDDERTELLEQVAGLEQRERRLRTELARRDRRFATLRMPEPPTLASVADRLAPDEAILAFQEADEIDRNLAEEGGSWLVVVTRDRVTTHRLPDRFRLQRQVPMLAGIVTRRDGSDLPALVRLHGELLAGALAELDPRIERLVIVPDGGLYDVPFAALRASASEPALAERFELTLAPSVTSLMQWRDRGDRYEGSLLALANATPGPGAPGVRGGVLEDGLSLGPLPRAETEAVRVAEIYGAAEVRTGTGASESYLKSLELQGFGVLHFAAHAVVDLDHPDRSGVALEAGDPGEDGLLQAREIVGLPLDGRVIVLSACSGLSGAPLRGEGLLSLARAFLLAGAHAVIASRWPLDDADALLLFERLYRYIDDGHTLAGALARAQRDLIDAGAPTAAWAGVVVLGRGDIVLRPRHPASRWLRRFGGPRSLAALTAALLGLFALVMAWRRRPRKA